MVYRALTSTGSMQMILYTNAGDSLGNTSELTDIVDVSASGYARMTLGTGWTFTNGTFQYDNGDPDNIIWTNSSAGAWPLDVVGAAMISSTPYTGGTLFLLHFRDFSSPITLASGGSIEVDINTLVG